MPTFTVTHLILTRPYFRTEPAGGFSAGHHLGFDGDLSREARRTATLAGVPRSFALAEALLRVLSDWKLDDYTIRWDTHAAATRAADRCGERADAERTPRPRVPQR